MRNGVKQLRDLTDGRTKERINGSVDGQTAGPIFLLSGVSVRGKEAL